MNSETKVVRVRAVPTITAGAYSSGDALGGKLVFGGAVGDWLKSGIVHSIQIVDLAKQNAAVDVVLFDRDFTATADNAAFDLVDVEAGHVLGVVQVAATDYASFSDNSLASVEGLSLPVVLNGTSLYAQLVVRGTPTYGTTADIEVTVTVLPD